MRALVADAPIGMVESDRDGTVVWVNERWRRLTGCDEPLPISRRTLLSLIHPDDRDHLSTLERRIMATGTAAEVEVAFVRPDDGEVRHQRVRIAPLLDDEGCAVGTSGTVTDITELVQARETSRRSEHRYRRLLLDAPIPQVLAEVDGTVVEVNQAFLEVMRTTEEQVLGSPGFGRIHPDEQAGMADRVQRLLDGEVTSFQVDRRIERFDGSEAWVTGAITLVHDEDGRPLLHAAMQDTTDRRRAEDDLRSSESQLRAVLDSLHEAVLVYRTDGIVSFNRAAVEISGLPPDRIGDREAWAAMRPITSDGRPMALEEGPSSEVLRTGRAVRDRVVGWDHAEKGLRWLLSSATPLVHDGETVGAVLSFSDITERKAAEDARRASEERYRHLVEHAPMGYLVLDREGYVVESNRAAANLLESSRDELVGTRALDRLHPDDQAALQARAEALWSGEVAQFESEHRLALPGRPHRWISIAGTLTPEMDAGRSFLVLIQDVDERRRAVEETTRLAHIVESTSDLVGLVDGDTGRLLYLNRAAREVAGLLDRDVTDIHYLDLFAEHPLASLGRRALPAMMRGEGWSGEVAMRRGDGSVIQVWQTLTPELDEDGRMTRISALGRDVTARRLLEEQLAHQASHDSLTGLPNRSHLLELLEDLLDNERPAGRAGRARTRGGRKDGPAGLADTTPTVAVLFLDLDRFKQVNDTLGHEAGDELLSEVARRIATVVRPEDTVARLGGDEFVLLCPDVADEGQARALAQRVVAAVESEPIVLGSSQVRVTVSVGIALSRGGGHPEALLRDADAAMYRAKELGRARLEVFDDALRARAVERSRRADELAIGIEDGQITTLYQPAVDLTTGEVVAVEALARWDHPRLGLLPPSEFITLAEETGLIVGLGLRVLTQACGEARRWMDDLDGAGPDVHVNLSARQLATPSLPRLVERVLETTGLPADHLCLEMTESVLMDDAAGAVAALEALAAVGVRIAIDDFGTGYSSLAYLHRFPVDVLKVDRSFVEELGPDPASSTIVAAIVNLATTLGLDAIAEGVETVEQLTGLQALGYRSAQGYLFARPVTADEMAAMVRRRWDV